MSKIVRLNNETIRLMEICRRDLKEELEKTKMTNTMKDVIKNDNLILQMALRACIEFNTLII